MHSTLATGMLVCLFCMQDGFTAREDSQVFYSHTFSLVYLEVQYRILPDYV